MGRKYFILVKQHRKGSDLFLNIHLHLLKREVKGNRINDDDDYNPHHNDDSRCWVQVQMEAIPFESHAKRYKLSLLGMKPGSPQNKCVGKLKEGFSTSTLLIIALLDDHICNIL